MAAPRAVAGGSQMSDITNTLVGGEGFGPISEAVGDRQRAGVGSWSRHDVPADDDLGPAAGIGLGLVLSGLIWLAIVVVL